MKKKLVKASKLLEMIHQIGAVIKGEIPEKSAQGLIISLNGKALSFQELYTLLTYSSRPMNTVLEIDEQIIKLEQIDQLLGDLTHLIKELSEAAEHAELRDAEEFICSAQVLIKTEELTDLIDSRQKNYKEIAQTLVEIKKEREIDATYEKEFERASLWYKTLREENEKILERVDEELPSSDLEEIQVFIQHLEERLSSFISYNDLRNKIETNTKALIDHIQKDLNLKNDSLKHRMHPAEIQLFEIGNFLATTHNQFITQWNQCSNKIAFLKDKKDNLEKERETLLRAITWFREKLHMKTELTSQLEIKLKFLDLIQEEEIVFDNLEFKKQSQRYLLQHKDSSKSEFEYHFFYRSSRFFSNEEQWIKLEEIADIKKRLDLLYNAQVPPEYDVLPRVKELLRNEYISPYELKLNQLRDFLEKKTKLRQQFLDSTLMKCLSKFNLNMIDAKSLKNIYLEEINSFKKWMANYFDSKDYSKTELIQHTEMFCRNIYKRYLDLAYLLVATNSYIHEKKQDKSSDFPSDKLQFARDIKQIIEEATDSTSAFQALRSFCAKEENRNIAYRLRNDNLGKKFFRALLSLLPIAFIHHFFKPDSGKLLSLIEKTVHEDLDLKMVK